MHQKSKRKKIKTTEETIAEFPYNLDVGKAIAWFKKIFFLKRQLYAKSKEKWQTEIKYFMYLYTLKQEKKEGLK